MAQLGNSQLGSTQSVDSDVDYWLVGSYWRGADPKERLPLFMEEGVWVNGYGVDQYGKLVNQVKEGDVLISKSTFFDSRTRESTLRVKGFGIVTNNPHDGTNLKVNWINVSLQYDLPRYGFYRDTIQRIRYADLKLFIAIINTDQELIEAILSDKNSADQILKHALSHQLDDENLISQG